MKLHFKAFLILLSLLIICQVSYAVRAQNIQTNSNVTLNADTSLPVIVSAWFNVGYAVDNQTIQAYANITDASGVAYADFGLYIDAATYVESALLTYNPTSQLWEGSYTVNATKFPTGGIYWGDSYVVDNAGNQGYLYGTALGYNDFTSPSLQIIVDTTIPYIASVSLSVTTAVDTELIFVTADITDPTGVVAADFRLYDSNKNLIESYSLFYFPNDGLWEGSFTINAALYPNNMIYWGDTYVEDGAGNSGYALGSFLGGSDFSSPSITIVPDTEPPTLLSQWFDVSTAVDGQIIHVYTIIYDPSGVYSAHFGLYNSSMDFIEAFNLGYNANSGYWESSFTIDASLFPDNTIYLGYIYADDVLGNSIYFYGTGEGGTDFTSPSITIVPDTFIPTIQSVWFDVSNATDGQVVNTYAEITDPSGVYSANFGLYDSNMNFVERYTLAYNSVSGYWEGSFVIDASLYFDNVIYWGDSVVADNLGNSGTIQGSGAGGNAFTSPSIAIIVDNQIPSIQSVWFDVSSANDGQLVHAYANITDDSGVNTANFGLYDSNMNYVESHTLIYNSSLQLWEGVFVVDAALYFDNVIYWGDSVVADNLGNSGTVQGTAVGGNAFTSPSIAIMMDNQIPTIQSVRFDVSTAKDGQLVHAYANITDDSGVYTANFSLYDSNMNFVESHTLIYNSSIQLWEGAFLANASMYPDNVVYWGDSGVTDNLGNSGVVHGTASGGNAFTSPQINITVNNNGNTSTNNGPTHNSSSSGPGLNLALPNLPIYASLFFASTIVNKISKKTK